jgi:hypothetical protein
LAVLVVVEGEDTYLGEKEERGGEGVEAFA